jgi:hypothetical protein
MSSSAPSSKTSSRRASRNEKRKQEKEELKKMRSLKQEWEKVPEEERNRIKAIDEILFKIRLVLISKPDYDMDIMFRPKILRSEPQRIPTPKSAVDKIVEIKEDGEVQVSFDPFREVTEKEKDNLAEKQKHYLEEEREKEKQRKKHVAKLFGETFYFSDDADDEKEDKREIKIEELD